MADRPRNENMIAALRRERASYAARGLDERVKLVDEQLRFYGDEPDGPQGRAQADAADGAKAPRGRRAPSKHTA